MDEFAVSCSVRDPVGVVSVFGQASGGGWAFRSEEERCDGFEE